MIHMIEGYVNALVTRFLASAVVLPSTTDPAQRAETINLLTFSALKGTDEVREEESVVDRQGRLKDFRSFVSKLVETDTAIWEAARDQRAGPISNENQNSACLGI